MKTAREKTEIRNDKIIREYRRYFNVSQKRLAFLLKEDYETLRRVVSNWKKEYPTLALLRDRQHETKGKI